MRKVFSLLLLSLIRALPSATTQLNTIVVTCVVLYDINTTLNPEKLRLSLQTFIEPSQKLERALDPKGQYPLIKAYSLNYSRTPNICFKEYALNQSRITHMILGVFLNYGILESLGP